MSDQQKTTISPEILAAASKYYSPEQLEEMAAKREQVKRQWSMKQVTTEVAPISQGVSREAREPLPIKTDLAELGHLFGGANIPDNAGSWEFATYPLDGDQVTKDEAWAFANRQTFQRGLYLWGKLGRGKTSLAISILKTFLARGESGLYIRAAQYLRLVNQIARGNEKDAAILDLAYSVACLVLDDLAVEQTTPAAIRQFYELVEERRGTNGLYTVITSNLSIDDLEERWRPDGVTPGDFHEGMRVTDRLRESWGELEIQGINLRTQRDE